MKLQTEGWPGVWTESTSIVLKLLTSRFESRGWLGDGTFLKVKDLKFKFMILLNFQADFNGNFIAFATFKTSVSKQETCEKIKTRF